MAESLPLSLHSLHSGLPGVPQLAYASGGQRDGGEEWTRNNANDQTHQGVSKFLYLNLGPRTVSSLITFSRLVFRDCLQR